MSNDKWFESSFLLGFCLFVAGAYAKGYGYYDAHLILWFLSIFFGAFALGYTKGVDSKNE